MTNDLKMKVAEIDKDYESDPGESVVGRTQWTVTELYKFSEYDPTEALPAVKTRFRLLDDDNNVYYGGWLLNDDTCAVQSIVLEWGTHYAGCTTIEVKKNGEWVREIG